MSERSNGTLRLPRGLAIIGCYIVFIAAVVGFMFLLVPRLSRDVARLGKEAPGLYKRINEEYTPELARWLEHRFPSLKPVRVAPEEQPIVPEVPLPPGTAFTMTPLPDGRFADPARREWHRYQAARRGRLSRASRRGAAEPLTLETSCAPTSRVAGRAARPAQRRGARAPRRDQPARCTASSCSFSR